MAETKKLWEGKKTAQIVLTLTPAEREDMVRAAKSDGGLSVSAYVRRLHHKAMGLIKEEGDKS